MLYAPRPHFLRGQNRGNDAVIRYHGPEVPVPIISVVSAYMCDIPMVLINGNFNIYRLSGECRICMLMIYSDFTLVSSLPRLPEREMAPPFVFVHGSAAVQRFTLFRVRHIRRYAILIKRGISVILHAPLRQSCTPLCWHNLQYPRHTK